jgi:hypothetical protein
MRTLEDVGVEVEERSPRKPHEPLLSVSYATGAET